MQLAAGWGSQANPAGLITLRSEVQIFHPLPFLLLILLIGLRIDPISFLAK
jgi:hypothetical protein